MYDIFAPFELFGAVVAVEILVLDVLHFLAITAVVFVRPRRFFAFAVSHYASGIL